MAMVSAGVFSTEDDGAMFSGTANVRIREGLEVYCGLGKLADDSGFF